MKTPVGLPILDHEYDQGRNAMSRALETFDGRPFPTRCVMSFMKDALDWYVEENSCERIARFHSEVRDFDIYAAAPEGVDICLVQAPVGAPAAAMMMDLLIASGVDDFIACGGCGVTEDLESGRLLVPTSALRDEGTSYHYAPPASEIAINAEVTESLTRTAADAGLRCSTCRVWTTDGFFRETPRAIRKRHDEGCTAIDMECSALAAVAGFYGKRFGELLYAGDSLADPDRHDARDWLANTNARQSTICVAALALARL